MNLSPTDWTIEHTHDNCVKIILGENIPLDKIKIKIISAERQLVEEEEISSREFEVCLPTEKPLFAELTLEKCLPCMKYIEKTGNETYKNEKTKAQN